MKYRYESRISPQQAEVIECEDRAAALMGGWRAGKSRILADWMHDRLEQFPRAQHYVVGADLPQLKRGYLNTFRQLLHGYGIEHEYLRSDGEIRIKHSGATLQALSAEMRERIMATEADTLLLEEPQTWKGGETTFVDVMSRLSGSPQADAVYGGRCIPMMRMSFNPVPVGHWIWELLEKRRSMRYWRFSVRENFLWPGRDRYVEIQEKLLPPDLWTVKLDGNWATFGGMVYRFYNAAVHGADAPDGLPAKELWPGPILWTHDFNVHKMCSVICQQVKQKKISLGLQPNPFGPPREKFRFAVEGWQERVLYAHDQIVLRDAGTPEVTAEFLRRFGEHARKHGVYLYGDPSAGRGQAISSTSAVRTAWDDIITTLRNAKIPLTLRVHSDSPSPGDRVAMVNAQFTSGDGAGFLIDTERCPDLVSDFRMVTYKEGTNDLDKTSNRELTHSSDALGYLIYVERMLARNPSAIKFKFDR